MKISISCRNSYVVCNQILSRVDRHKRSLVCYGTLDSKGLASSSSVSSHRDNHDDEFTAMKMILLHYSVFRKRDFTLIGLLCTEKLSHPLFVYGSDLQ